MKKLTKALLLLTLSSYLLFFYKLDGDFLVDYLRIEKIGDPRGIISFVIFFVVLVSLFLSCVYWKEIRSFTLRDFSSIFCVILFLYIIENPPKIKINIPLPKLKAKVRGYVSCKENIYVKFPFPCVVITKNKVYYIDKNLTEGLYIIVGEFKEIDACVCVLPKINIKIITTEDKCKIGSEKGICEEKVRLKYISAEEYEKIS